LVIASVVFARSNGLDLVIGGVAVALGTTTYRWFESGVGAGIEGRPSYVDSDCTVRITEHGLGVDYPHVSTRIGWPAVTQVVNTAGLYLLYSGRAAVFSLPVGSLGPDENEQFAEFLTERALLRFV
jgi:YcxB-like protein